MLHQTSYRARASAVAQEEIEAGNEGTRPYLAGWIRPPSKLGCGRRQVTPAPRQVSTREMGARTPATRAARDEGEAALQQWNEKRREVAAVGRRQVVVVVWSGQKSRVCRPSHAQKENRVCRPSPILTRCFKIRSRLNIYFQYLKFSCFEHMHETSKKLCESFMCPGAEPGFDHRGGRQ